MDYQYAPNTTNGMWIRPYYNQDKIELDNLPKVKTKTYGVLIGLDGKVIEFDNGVDAVFSAYVAYNGARMKYEDAVNTQTKIDQTGANIGVMGAFYNGNFFGAVSVGVGTNKSTVKIQEGNSSFNSFIGSLALKGGYNYQPFEDFILQPNLSMIYSYINSKDYTLANGTDISSKAMNAFQIAPAVKLIKLFDEIGRASCRERV